jgi:hypothetical protein
MNPVSSQHPSRPSLVLSYGLCGVAIVALAFSGWILVSRSQASSNARNGFALLERSMRSEQQQIFSASVKSISFVCGQKSVSQSKIVQAPQHTSIQWISGPMQGAESGLSKRWLWRRAPGGKVLPYAEVADTNQKRELSRLNLLQRNYNAVLGEKSSYAGRTVQEVELKPKTAKGPARRFFIDLETGIVLKTQGFDSDLNPVFETSLQNVDFTPEIAQSTFGKPAILLAAAKESSWRGEELGSDSEMIAKKVGFLPPKSTYLPLGFELDGYGLHRCETPDGMTACASFARYSDGLNSLTVFAMKPCSKSIKPSEATSEMCDFGAGKLASRSVGEGRLIVVADLPATELEKVLAASAWQKK